MKWSTLDLLAADLERGRLASLEDGDWVTPALGLACSLDDGFGAYLKPICWISWLAPDMVLIWFKVPDFELIWLAPDLELAPSLDPAGLAAWLLLVEGFKSPTILESGPTLSETINQNNRFKLSQSSLKSGINGENTLRSYEPSPAWFQLQLNLLQLITCKFQLSHNLKSQSAKPPGHL